jgi:hypothetical protein
VREEVEGGSKRNRYGGREGWWVGGRGGDIRGTQGGREKEEKMWGMGRVG